MTTEKVSRFVERKNLELAKENTVSSEPVKVEVRWEKCPNLSFIDLPGLRALAMNEKDNLLKVQIEEMIQKVITEHSKQSNVRFLVVEDAKEDTANYFGTLQSFHRPFPSFLLHPFHFLHFFFFFEDENFLAFSVLFFENATK